MTGIIGNGNTAFLSVYPADIIGKSLCSLAHGINIHPVGSGSDHTTKSGCTKFQIHIKTVFDLFFISLNTFQLISGILVKIRIVQPALIIFFVSHFSFLPYL